MVLRNLIRRKGRTTLTALGVAIGVAAIVVLGAFARGLKAGYGAMMAGSRADLVLSRPSSFDISLSSVDEEVGEALAAMPEVEAVAGMLQGMVQAEGNPYFFVFGYSEGSFTLSRFALTEGSGLYSREAQRARGKPILLGSAAAETMKKRPGDTVRVMGGVYRVVGLYQTGSAFEDSGALLRLEDAQDLLNKPRQVSLYYVRLSDPGMHPRLQEKATRLWPELSLSDAAGFADKQLMGDATEALVWVIAGLAIVIGGVGMVNAQLMSVFERTREIGVLRAVGWSGRRVLAMVLSETLAVSGAGGLLGTGLGYGLLVLITRVTSIYGVSTANVGADLLLQATGVVLVLGLVGGLYPAWRASRLQPVEALRYEGGSGGRLRHLPYGGMALQSLWRRTTRTLLALGAIGITVGAVVALEAMVNGAKASFTGLAVGSGVEIMVRQADVSDTSLSALDERLGHRIAALPGVANVSGLVFTAITMPEAGGFFIIQGYAPQSYAVRRFRIIEGRPLSGNRQIILGRPVADSLHKSVGDSITLDSRRFRVVGLFESSVSWEELGGVMTLRDAQAFTGNPRKVTMMGVKLEDPARALEMVAEINRRFPEAHAALAGEFAEQTPDMEATGSMIDGTAALAVGVGGVGVMNTMLMSVLERTREIGVLRALGWRRRSVIGLILREAALLGVLGGVTGMAVALALTQIVSAIPFIGEVVAPVWTWGTIARAAGVALVLGLGGGLYPAYRATRLAPVEALRYE